MFTNEKDKLNRQFGNEIQKRLSDAEHVEIAVGYFGHETLEKIKPKLLKIAKRGSCKLLFGMIYHEGWKSEKQKDCAMKLHQELKKINPSSSIFITKRRYHGKVYKFVKNNKSTIYVGSSNLSVTGFKTYMEFNIEVTDNEIKKSTTSFLDYHFVGQGIEKDDSAPIDDPTVDIKLNKAIKKQKTKKSLKDFEIDKKDYPKGDFENSFKIRHRPNVQPISSLNLYFSKGRGTTKDGKTVYKRRNWYEVEVTSLLTERKKYKDYPIGEFTAYVEDNGKYYKLQMITSSGNKKDKYKAIQTSKKGGGREILGMLIKGKMERMGILNGISPITDEILEEYGKNYIELAKIGNKKYLMKV